MKWKNQIKEITYNYFKAYKIHSKVSDQCSNRKQMTNLKMSKYCQTCKVNMNSMVLKLVRCSSLLLETRISQGEIILQNPFILKMWI